MKILHILNELRYSGAELMLKAAARRFIDHGLELHALSTGEELGPFAAELQSSGYRIHHIPIKKSPVHFVRLYRFIRNENFEIVHIHPEGAFLENALVARLAGCRLIVRTVHNSFQFSGLLRLRKRLERWMSRKCLKAIFVSIGQSVAENERLRFSNPSILVPNWVDHERFTPLRDSAEREALRDKHAIPRSAFVIISVGSCIEQKNHSAILCAMSQLLQGCSLAFYLHVGQGPLLNDEFQKAKRLAIDGRCRFVNQSNEIRELLAASDVFVMSSSHEGLSISSIEAMSCGLPVVAYNVIGLRDVVEHGKTGFLIEPNVDALTKAIMDLAGDAALRRSMSTEARLSAQSRFSMAKSLETLKALYAP